MQRFVRDTTIARKVKNLHKHRCQLCGERITLPDGRLYSEAHHIRPLKKPYDGRDNPDNILCVCPNHHVQLDYACIRLDPKKLRQHQSHKVSLEHIDTTTHVARRSPKMIGKFEA
ncbi:MAG: HNH endonuclease [Limisphaerales bacterium]